MGRKWPRGGAVAVCALALAVAGCGEGDDGDAAELQSQVSQLQGQVDDLEQENADLRTQLSTPETSEATTTTRPSTTTTAPETTTTTPPAQGLLWTPPAEEGVGIFTANDTTTHLTAVLLVDTSQHQGDHAEQCQDEIDFEVEYSGWTDPPTYCLYAQWSYDVGANAPVSDYADEICLSPGDMVSLDGRQITKAVTNCALPGTRENRADEMYAGGGAGSLLRFDVGNNEVRENYQVQIPGPEAFVPYTG